MNYSFNVENADNLHNDAFNLRVQEMKDRLDEKFRDAIKLNGIYEEILENPSKSEMYSLPAWKDYKEVKFMIANNNIFMWGSDAPVYHQHIEKELNIKPEDSIRLYYNGKSKIISGLAIGSLDNSMGGVNPKQARKIIENMKPKLKILFGDYSLRINFAE